jgi:hypothetical protein
LRQCFTKLFKRKFTDLVNEKPGDAPFEASSGAMDKTRSNNNDRDKVLATVTLTEQEIK